MGLALWTKRGRLFFAGLTVLALMGAITIHGYVHEALGHGLFSLLLGGFFDGFYVSPFSVSYAIGYVFFHPEVDAIRALAGTAVSTAVGFAILSLVYPRVQSFQWRYTTLVAAAAFQFDWIYAFFSLAGGIGDMHGVASKLHADSAPLAVLVLPVIVAVYYPILSKVLQLVRPYYGYSKAGFGSNFKILLLCVALPALLYAVIIEVYSPAFSILYGTPIDIFPGGIMLGISVIFLPVVLVAWKKRRAQDGLQETFYPRKMITGAALSAAILAVNFAVMGPIYYLAWGLMWDEHPWYYNVAVRIGQDSSAYVTIKSVPGWASSDLWLSGSKTARYDNYVSSALDVTEKMFSEYSGAQVEVVDTYTEDGYLFHTQNIYPRPLRVIELEVTGLQFGDQVSLNAGGFDAAQTGSVSSGNQLQLFSISVDGRKIADLYPKEGQVARYDCSEDACVAGISPLSYVVEEGSIYWDKQYDRYAIDLG